MYEEEEAVETMTVQEVARLIDWMRAKGLSDTDICNCIKFIATGVNLPTRKTA